MYVATVFTFFARRRRDGNRLPVGAAISDALWVTSQLVAGIFIMSASLLDFAGEGYLRAWFGMIIAMALADAARSTIFTYLNKGEGTKYASI